MRAVQTESVIYGVNAIAALIEHSPERVLRVLYSSRGASGLKGARAALIETARASGVEVEGVRERQIEHYAQQAQHQGVIAFITPRDFSAWRDLCDPERRPLLVAMDQVTDPHNFGAILRSAEAFGVSGVLITSNRCARPGPTVARTSAGMSELIEVAMETNLSDSLSAAQERGYQVVGAALEGQPMSGLDWSVPTVIVIGAEGKGLRAKTTSRCDHLVKIPMFGRAESLNASVAAGVMFYEATRHKS